MGFFSAALEIAAKDLRVEFKRAYEILSILTFSVSAILICSFAWGGAITTNPQVTAAALWIILFFATILTLTTAFTRETDRGTLGGLKTLPCSPAAILFGKILYVTTMLLFVTCIVLSFSFVFLNLKMPERSLDFLIIFVLGAVDLAIAGSFVSALVMFSDGKTLILSFLLFPVCVPVFIPSVLATAKVMTGVDVLPELRLLLAFLFLVIVVSHLTFRFILEE